MQITVISFMLFFGNKTYQYSVYLGAVCLREKDSSFLQKVKYLRQNSIWATFIAPRTYFICK